MATQSGENSKDLTQNQFGFTLPIALKEHYEYLQSLSKNEDFDVNTSLKEDYKVPLLCNTFSTAQDYFQVLISDLIKSIAGGNVLNVGNQIDQTNLQTIEMAGSNVQAYAPTVPMSMEILDQMSVHAKMSLTHSIGNTYLSYFNSSICYFFLLIFIIILCRHVDCRLFLRFRCRSCFRSPCLYRICHYSWFSCWNCV